jgi:hypothetical protein
MSDVNEENKAPMPSEGNQQLEKASPAYVQPMSEVPSDVGGADTPSEGALEELIPQLTRRGTINPDSPYFSTEKFLRNILEKAKEQGLKRRTAGVCFKGLVVLGYGSGFSRQNTVGTVATSIFRIVDTIRERHHPPMKTILYSMSGLVKEGEMLLVLGKPGSGATTLLKTIAGETRSYASVSGGTIYQFTF